MRWRCRLLCPILLALLGAALLAGAGCGGDHPGPAPINLIAPICGDGVAEGGEECDNGDGIQWPPTKKDGDYNCDNPDQCTCRKDCTRPYCGDGIVDTPRGEECDDGPDNSDTVPDACRLSCRNPVCGDGIVDPEGGETCDCGTDPDNLPADCLAPNCDDPDCDEADPDCVPISVNCTCRTDCQPAGCGDGILDTATEECDCGDDPDDLPLGCTAVNGVNSKCLPTCRLATCGDGFTCTATDCKTTEAQTPEECDDGDANSDTEPNACRTKCTLPTCGDGVADDGEACDCGTDPDNLPAGCNGVNSDTPNATCRPTCVAPTCGDGVVDDQAGIPEECDCGTDADNLPEGCLTPNSDTEPNACRTTCTRPVCGDKVVDDQAEPPEQCDCGTDPADLPAGCTMVNCDGAGCLCTTACESVVCGNGVVDPGEQCDCGTDPADLPPGCNGVNSLAPNATCRPSCKQPSCGDKVIDDQRGEECDCGNVAPPAAGCSGVNSNLPNRACRTTCKIRKCGDGIVDDQFGETCDDNTPTHEQGFNCVMPGCQKQYGPAMVVDTLSINPDVNVGCDLNVPPDGTVDNVLGQIGTLVNPMLRDAVLQGQLIFLFELRRLNDATGQNDASIDLANYQGLDHEDPAFADDNFTGQEPFYIDPLSVQTNGDPLVVFSNLSLTAGAFAGTTDNFLLPFASAGTLVMKRARVTGHIDVNAASISGVEIKSQPAQLCGVVTACSLDRLMNPVPEYIAADTLLEALIVAGQNPDVDMDGDGTETYLLQTKPGPWFSLSYCVDGDGSMVGVNDPASPTGRCPCNPRFVDGYSITTNFTTVGADLLKVCSGSTPPCQ